MDRETRLRRTRYRAWHRGTREADAIIGGFFDRYGQDWTDEDLDWFDLLLEEQDVDIMAWAMGRADPPPALNCANMDRLCGLDFIELPDALKSGKD